jgi:hypothetical protein
MSVCIHVDCIQLVAVIADSELVEIFVQSAVELISFALNGSNGLFSSRSASHATVSSTHSITTTSTTTASAHTGSGTSSGPMHPSHQMQPQTLPVSSSPSQTFFYKDEVAPDIWPPPNDARLQHLVLESQQYGGVCDLASQWHMCLLWVLQLRTQCGLRGVKVSELIGEELLLTMCGEESLSTEWGEMYTATYADGNEMKEHSDGE